VFKSMLGPCCAMLLVEFDNSWRIAHTARNCCWLIVENWAALKGRCGAKVAARMVIG
jgi:hypothetical protein